MWKAHHWQSIFLTLHHPVNKYLLQCTTYVSGRLMSVFRWKCHWRLLCTETQRHGEAAGSVSEDKRCLGQRTNLTHNANHTLGWQQACVESPESDGTVSTLHDMGFSDAQIKQLFALRPPGSSGIQQSLTTVSELLLMGLNIETVLKVLHKCPDVQSVTAPQLKDRTAYLRKLGLGEGSLQRVISYCPSLLTVSQKQAMKVAYCLKERCLFSTQQVTEILRTCPWVLQEQPEDLEYKFQYAYFRLGIQQQELVKTRLFHFPIEELKYRHSFLERLGLYQTPDKKGQTQIYNPKLKAIVNYSEDAFLAKIARSTHEEFQVFKKLLDREEEEQIREEEYWEGDMEEDQDEEEKGSSDSSSEGDNAFSDDQALK